MIVTSWSETLGPGNYLARRLRRDTVLRIEDTEGDACVQLLAFNANNTGERFNPGDTMKIPWQAYIGQGSLILSDMGRVLMTVIDDNSGRHDCICSGSNRKDNDTRYGDGSIGGGAPNARDLLSLAGAKEGLSRSDIGPCLNLFKAVRVAPDGALTLEREPRGGLHVELRAEMNVIVLLANTPHRLDDRATYSATAAVVAGRMETRPLPDPFRAGADERLRLFENTETYASEVM